MRVSFCLDVNQEDGDSGKHKFFIRLAKEMKKRGVEIVSSKADVHLMLPRMPPDGSAKVNVLRLNGLILNSRWPYKKKNKMILESINTSDVLVYQGNFCEEAYRRFMKVNKKYRIISNGADPSEFLNRQPQNFLLANCKWRPHKRREAIITTFLTALDMGLDADLVITGGLDKTIKHPRIKYRGWVGKYQLRKYLSKAIASLHFSWLDWFPNSMVEAIVSKCPIIYTRSGGHEDVAKNSGIGIKDVQWNFKVCDLYSPPDINYEEGAKAMIESKKGNNVVEERKDLHIKTVATQYMEYFDSLLKGL